MDRCDGGSAQRGSLDTQRTLGETGKLAVRSSQLQNRDTAWPGSLPCQGQGRGFPTLFILRACRAAFTTRCVVHLAPRSWQPWTSSGIAQGPRGPRLEPPDPGHGQTRGRLRKDGEEGHRRGGRRTTGMVTRDGGQEPSRELSNHPPTGRLRALRDQGPPSQTPGPQKALAHQ